MGTGRTKRLEATYRVNVVVRHFPLHPDTPVQGLTLERLFAGRDVDLAAMHSRIARLMADEGLPYGPRPRTHTYNSRLAQELAAWGVTHPAGERLHGALFEAYFVEGINLADGDRLVRIAQEVGLPGSAAREVLQTRSHREIVDEDWRRSSELGITGVPTFVIGNRGVVGAQPYEVLERLLLEGGARPRT